MTNPEGPLVSEASTPRPRSVTVALALIGASLVVGALVSAVRLFASASPEGAHQPSRGLTLAVYLVAYAVAAGLAAALFHRRRWAYWVWLLVFALSLPALWSGLPRSLDQGAFSASRYVLLTAAEVVAAILLLRRPARRWYGVGRKPGEPSPWRMSDNPREP